ncbi:MAG TPA: NAD(+) synthase, partial [Saprospiraceae bacterium]|nr:NAD(+) synthase [Saprospiraceae bacterium]
GKRIALTVCEDMWNIGNENPLYDVCPMDMLIEQRPDFAVNISAVNFYIGKASLRKKVITSNAVKYKIPFFTVNHIGAQTGLIFDGGSSVASPDGLIFREMPCFEEALEVFDLDEVIKGNHEDEVVMGEIELIHKALIVGIQDYFKKQNLSSAILGLSGGLDSAVVAALATEALGKENVRGLLMPSQYSSSHSLEDAISLAQNLGIRFDIVPIKDIFDQYIFTLQPLFAGMPENVTEENLQARIRAMLLMAVSNKYGNILLNTSNKSEVAVGYGTLYGDVCGAISVLGDVYKTEVYRLAHFINRDRIIVPLNTINKAPSAELRPGQKDSDSLPPYEVLDQILYEHIENGKGSTEIVELGFDAQMVENILRKVKFNEFKRRQAPPVLRVSRKAFGLGRKMPIVNGFSM